MSGEACEEARALLLEYQRGRLTAEQSQKLEAHLAQCAACARAAEGERVLSELLRTKLPRPAAPAALMERLAADVAALAPKPPSPPAVLARKPRPLKRALPWLAFATAAAIGLAVALWPMPSPAREAFLREAVNDHLRVLYASQPMEVASGGIHQVKPWFTGRIDFAPDVAFSGNEDFPLLGGAVGFFIDRKAATFMFKRRLHTISLFVFRADGLWSAWTPYAGELDGFHVLCWRSKDLEHVLVSDVSAVELTRLQRLLASTK